LTKGRRHKSKMYEEWYGQPYTLKTLVEVKVCQKCGRELPITSTDRNCPYCRGPLITKCIPKQKA
jgi:rubrerythrin